MALTGSLGTFHHPGVSRIDYKPLDMDRVLTALLARLWHHGMPSKISRTATLDVDVFVKLFLDHPEVFDGFDRETTTRWTVTHLMDMVNRGRADEAVAAPRPLHGFTYRFRNSRKSRPYGADEQLYEMLSEDEGALKGLREFFFSDVDRATGIITPGPDTDVETQALLHLVELAGWRVRDQADTSKPRAPYPPLCAEPAQLLCQDVMRLLYHQDRMPRTVLVDYLKTLFAFHLALYHLRMMKLLPAAVEAGTIPVTCRKGHNSRAAADRCSLPGAALSRRGRRSRHPVRRPRRTQRGHLVPAHPPLHPGDLPGEETRRLRRVPRQGRHLSLAGWTELLHPGRSAAAAGQEAPQRPRCLFPPAGQPDS